MIVIVTACECACLPPDYSSDEGPRSSTLCGERDSVFNEYPRGSNASSTSTATAVLSAAAGVTVSSAGGRGAVADSSPELSSEARLRFTSILKDVCEK